MNESLGNNIFSPVFTALLKKMFEGRQEAGTVMPGSDGGSSSWLRELSLHSPGKDISDKSLARVVSVCCSHTLGSNQSKEG